MWDLGFQCRWKLVGLKIANLFPALLSIFKTFFFSFVLRQLWIYVFQRIKKCGFNVFYNATPKSRNMLFSYSESKQSCTQKSKPLVHSFLLLLWSLWNANVSLHSKFKCQNWFHTVCSLVSMSCNLCGRLTDRGNLRLQHLSIVS